MADPNYHNFDLFFQREGDGYRVRADFDEGRRAARLRCLSRILSLRISCLRRARVCAG